VVALTFLVAPVLAATVPKELFSPLVPQKILATFKGLPNPTRYPQYTNQQAGVWQLFSADTWTSGFFPATLYALNTRRTLCGATPANGLGLADWLESGREASAALVPLEIKNNQGHDVGFLSYPFLEELAVYVKTIALLKLLLTFDTTSEIRPIRRLLLP
jgi:hypothetical protein